MKFFDEYEQFYKTSLTSPYPYRLNGRFRAIIDEHVNEFSGARVLDIASHDGRWSFAALKAGAKHVTGIEPRRELIDNAIETFRNYGVKDDSYSFLCGNVFNELRNQKFDVVMCLGFYYHTVRHAELLDLIERTGAKFVIIDTEVTPLNQTSGEIAPSDVRNVFNNPYQIQLLKDQVDDQQMACEDSLTRNGFTLAGRPSREAIEFMADHFGYDYASFDWKAYFKQNPDYIGMMQDYHEDWRGTYYLRKRENVLDVV